MNAVRKIFWGSVLLVNVFYAGIQVWKVFDPNASKIIDQLGRVEP